MAKDIDNVLFLSCMHGNMLFLSCNINQSVNKLNKSIFTNATNPIKIDTSKSSSTFVTDSNINFTNVTNPLKQTDLNRAQRLNTRKVTDLKNTIPCSW